MQSLRKNLSDYYNTQYNLNGFVLTPDDLLVTTGGSSHALSLSFEMLMRNNNGLGELIILSPFFGPYTGMCQMANGNPILVDTDKDFLPDLERIEKAITNNTKAILINSPNNPTGKIYSK
jgi:aspartate/methionine/tyrosine aminotransferase